MSQEVRARGAFYKRRQGEGFRKEMYFMRLLRECLSCICNKNFLGRKSWFRSCSGAEVHMRIIGIDYGDSRIGIAMSDPFGWTAQGIETIDRKDGLPPAMIRLEQLIREYGVEKIIVGFPRNMNGTIGPRGEETLKYIDLLAERFDMEIIKWDERLTTVAASRTMHEIGVKTSRKKSIVDQIAASYILQGYLDSIKK